MIEPQVRGFLIDNFTLMAEWNSGRNTDVFPDAVTISISKKAW